MIRSRSGRVPTGFSRKRASVIVIQPGRADRNYWQDLWHYRELFAILAWRDIAVRYKQTVIGVAWAVVRPFLTMVIFTIVFGNLAKLPSDGGAPYPILVFAGMLPWFLFSSILSEASNSLDRQRKSYQQSILPAPYNPGFRRRRCDCRPRRQSGHPFRNYGLVSFRSGLAYRLSAGLHLLAVIASLGPALLITSMNVKYRDFRYIIPFLVQFGLYVSPVGFSSSVVPAAWRFWYSLNPVVGAIDGFRWCLLGGESELYFPGFIANLSVVFFFLWYGFLLPPVRNARSRI